MTFPTFELPEIEPRRPWGWIGLLSILALLIFSTLALYFTKSPYDSLLRNIVLQRDAGAALESQVGKIDADKVEGHLRKLRETMPAKPINAAYLVVIEGELGKTPDEQALRLLRASSKDANRALAASYEARALDQPTASELSRRLRHDGRFVYDVGALRTLEKGGLRKPTPAKSGPQEIDLLGGALVIILFGTGCLLIIGYILSRTSGRLQPLGSPSSGMTLVDADRYAARATQLLLIYIGLPLGAAALGGLIEPPWGEPTLLLLIAIASLSLFALPIGGVRISLARLGLTRHNLGKNIVWGICGALANLPVLMVVTAIFMSIPGVKDLPPPEHPMQFELQGSPGAIQIAIALFSAAVIAPIWEEITFRGVMLPAFARISGSAVFGIVITSLIFASLHPQGIPLWPALGMVGAASAMLTYQTKSLVPSIAMHATHNLLIVLANTFFIQS